MYKAVGNKINVIALRGRVEFYFITYGFGTAVSKRKNYIGKCELSEM
jgi:hypothetical protein